MVFPGVVFPADFLQSAKAFYERFGLPIHKVFWLEWFADGQLAGRYEKYLADQDNILVPAIVLYEVYKVLKRDVGEEKALLAVGYMKNASVIPLDETIALAAADIALRESLAMADAIIVATAHSNNCTIITSDADLKDQARVEYIPKS